MNLGRWSRRSRTVEERLRYERPQPSERLVRSIRGELRPRAARRLMRPALRSVVLTGVGLVALGAVGGLGFAASGFSYKVADFANHLFISKKAVRVEAKSSAAAQYGTTTTATTSTTTTTTTTTTTSGATTSSSGTVVASAPSQSSGSLSVTPPGATAPVATVVWTPSVFTQPVTLNVQPQPTLPTGTRILGPENSKVVSIVIKDDNGNVVHELAAPLEVVIPNPGAGFIPMVSEDGSTFRALSKIPDNGTTLGADDQDGYFVDSAGDYHILTRHLTIFAALYKANATISESGRKLAAPGSGKWGDPALIHPGPPTVRILKGATRHGDKAAFRFFLDEQVAGYFWIRYRGTNERIDAQHSSFFGKRIGGANRRTVHIPILRLGTIGVVLKTAKPLPTGAAVHFTFIDYDGHKVTKTLRIK